MTNAIVTVVGLAVAGLMIVSTPANAQRVSIDPGVYCASGLPQYCRPPRVPQRHYAPRRHYQPRPVYRQQPAHRPVYRQPAYYHPRQPAAAPCCAVARPPAPPPCCGTPAVTNPATPPGTPGGGYVAGAPRNAQECVARGGIDTGQGCRGYN